MAKSHYRDRSPLTQSLLKERMTYDPLTGFFVWLRSYGRVKAGERAGTLDDRGYRQIMVNQKFYYAHQLAWLYMTGEFPSFEIDHRNLQKDDNAWVNLRPSDRSKNNANKESQNPLGKGVRQEGLKFRATISHNKETTLSPLYDTPEEAAAAYREMANRKFGEHARY